jgi:hypothetical protein
MTGPTIWFNRGLSSVSKVIDSIRAAQQPGDNFRYVGSHVRSDSPVKEAADAFETEPTSVSNEAYLEWCLDFARRHDVKVFLPRRHSRTISGASDRFAAQGTTVVKVASPEMLDVIHSKASLYGAVPPGLVPLPDFRVVTDVDGFARACEAIAAGGHEVCYKPTIDIAGRGFRTVSFDGTPRFSPWNGKQISVNFYETLVELSAQETFPELMVMQMLNGQETSIDCLGDNGKLCGAIGRIKSFDGNEELIADKPELVEYCRRLTQELKLSGLYNVQFMESHGKEFFLEINSRMSGGIHYGTASGVCLPYWACRLALGTATAGDVPQPKTNIVVPRVRRPVL